MVSRSEALSTLLHSPDPSSALFQSSDQRFLGDFATLDAQNRRRAAFELQKKQEKFAIAAAVRAAESRAAELAAEAKERRRLSCLFQQRVDSRAAMEALDPISLDYRDSPFGREMRRQDLRKKGRAALRAQNIDLHQNSQFNLVNGLERHPVVVNEEVLNLLEQQLIWKFK